MPYIKATLNQRTAANDLRDSIDGEPKTPGVLNYYITNLLDEYVSGQLCYQSINDCLGALEGAKLEFVRRVVNSYEQKKLEENGDVYRSI